MSRHIKDLTGQQFGHWEVLSFSFIGKNNHNDAYWSCRCGLCGTVHDVRSDSLQSGGSTKCMQCAIQERIYGHV